MERYEYSDDRDPEAEQNDLDFTIKNGRVIEIVHTVLGLGAYAAYIQPRGLVVDHVTIVHSF